MAPESTYRVDLTWPEEGTVERGLALYQAVDLARAQEGDAIVIDEQTGEPADLTALGFEL